MTHGNPCVVCNYKNIAGKVIVGIFALIFFSIPYLTHATVFIDGTRTTYYYLMTNDFTANPSASTWYFYCPSPINYDIGVATNPYQLWYSNTSNFAVSYQRYVSSLGNDWWKVTEVTPLSGYNYFMLVDSSMTHSVMCGAYIGTGIEFNDTGVGIDPPTTATVTIVAPPSNGSTTIPINWINAQFSNLIATHTYSVWEQTSWTIPTFLGIGQSTTTVTGLTIEGSGDYFNRLGYSTAFIYPINGIAAQTFAMQTYIQAEDITNTADNLIYGIYASSTINWFMIPLSDEQNRTNVIYGTSTVLNNAPTWLNQATSTNLSSSTWDGTVGTSTTIVGNSLYQNSIGTTTQSGCTQWTTPTSTGIFDIGNGLLYAGCQIIRIAIDPTAIPGGMSVFNNSLTYIESVPPFSPFFGITNSVESGLNNFNNATTTGVSIGILGYGSNNTAVQTDLVDVNATTFNNGTGSSRHTSHPTSDAVNFMETYIEPWLWLGAGIKLLVIFTT